MISVVVLQNGMDLLKSEASSSNETFVTSTLYGIKGIGMEAGRVSDITDVANQEAIPAVKTDPNVSGMLLVCVTHIP